MANPRLAPTILTSRAVMSADIGPDVAHYEIPLDFPALYKFAVGDTSTADNVAVIGATGGTGGNWLRVRLDERGADLTDADATIVVGGNAWRVLPAATLTANRTITLGTTNAAAGDAITITRLDATAFTLAIVNGGSGAGTLCTLPISQRWWVECRFDGTDWSLHSAGQFPS